MVTEVKKIKGTVLASSIKNFKNTTYLFYFEPPHRPGAMDAFKLPSVFNGERVDAKVRPATDKGAVGVPA